MSNILKELRKEIDVVDRELVSILARRFKITHKVGVYKAQFDMPSFDKKRESEILEHKKLLAKKYNINPLLVEKIFKLVMAETRKNHRYEKNGNSK
jgi:monofunctional chorismate mutase